MIEKYYAAHIKTALDTAAINVRRERPHPAKELAKQARRKRRQQEKDQKRAAST